MSQNPFPSVSSEDQQPAPMDFAAGEYVPADHAQGTRILHPSDAVSAIGMASQIFSWFSSLGSF